jgi:hypothetical protein
MLQSLGLANGGRIVMADNNGIKIADSDTNETFPFPTKPRNNHHLQASRFKNDINGNTGTVEETQDGSKAFVFITPIKSI